VRVNTSIIQNWIKLIDIKIKYYAKSIFRPLDGLEQTIQYACTRLVLIHVNTSTILFPEIR